MPDPDDATRPDAVRTAEMVFAVPIPLQLNSSATRNGAAMNEIFEYNIHFCLTSQITWYSIMLNGLVGNPLPE
jgi:hypothetical protein